MKYSELGPNTKEAIIKIRDLYHFHYNVWLGYAQSIKDHGNNAAKWEVLFSKTALFLNINIAPSFFIEAIKAFNYMTPAIMMEFAPYVLGQNAI